MNRNIRSLLNHFNMLLNVDYPFDIFKTVNYENEAGCLYFPSFIDSDNSEYIKISGNNTNTRNLISLTKHYAIHYNLTSNYYFLAYRNKVVSVSTKTNLSSICFVWLEICFDFEPISTKPYLLEF